MSESWQEGEDAKAETPVLKVPENESTGRLAAPQSDLTS